MFMYGVETERSKKTGKELTPLSSGAATLERRTNLLMIQEIGRKDHFVNMPTTNFLILWTR